MNINNYNPIHTAFAAQRSPNFLNLASNKAVVNEQAKPIQAAQDKVNISDSARNNELEKIKKALLPQDSLNFISPTDFLNKVVEAITGSKVADLNIQNSAGEVQTSSYSSSKVSDSYQVQQNQSSAGAGQVYEQTTINHQETYAHIQVSGIVKTQDGQQFNFKMDIQYTQILQVEEHQSIHASSDSKLSGSDSNPLVLYFNGPASALQNSNFNFGQKLDKNKNDNQKQAPGISGSGSLSFYKKQIQSSQDFSNFFDLGKNPDLSKLQIWIQNLLENNKEKLSSDSSNSKSKVVETQKVDSENSNSSEVASPEDSQSNSAINSYVA